MSAAERAKVWLDTETTDLAFTRRAWEVALIRREPGGQPSEDREYSWLVDIQDLDLSFTANLDSLRVGGFWRRHPQAMFVPLIGNLASARACAAKEVPGERPAGQVYREREVLEAVAELTAGKTVIHGSNPGFDTETLAPRMRQHGITHDWYYHSEDVPGIARGWLLGRGVPNVVAPRKSDLISLACGIDPARYGRHEALGDCRWIRDLTDLVEAPHGGGDFAPVAAWNLAFPVGTPVRYWSGVREGEGVASRTRTLAEVLGGHTAVVWLEAGGGAVALSHVEPIVEG
jgi:hypothetical protein